MVSMRTWVVGWVLVWCAAASAAGSSGRAADYDLEVGAFEFRARVETATTLVLALELRNRGGVAWSPDLGFAIAYHWLRADGEVVVWDGVRTPLTQPLSPGESRVVEATLRTPDRAGDYLLQWDVVQEGQLWISEVDPSPVDLEPVSVVPSHAFSLLAVKCPRILRAGGERGASVAVRNDGTRVWPGDGSVSFAYHWWTADGEPVEWEGRRSPLTRPVAPGESFEISTTVVAPPSSGRVALQWDMVEENECWFSERDPSPEPPVVVLVLPATVIDPVLWTILVTLAALIAVGMVRLRRFAAFWTVADVTWTFAAVALKQAWVLAEAGLGFSVAGWCFVCASAALMGSILLLLPERFRPWASWLTGLVATVVLFADLIHVRFFGDLLSLAALRSAGQIGQVGASVRSLLDPGDIWFFADLLVGLLLIWAVTRMPCGSVRRRRSVIAFGLVALGCGALGALQLRGAPSSFRQVFHTTHLARQIGVLNLHASDLGRSGFRGMVQPELNPDELRSVEAYFEARRESRAGSGPFFGAARDRNLVMIQVESLQAFVIGLSVGGREVTPSSTLSQPRTSSLPTSPTRPRRGGHRIRNSPPRFLYCPPIAAPRPFCTAKTTSPGWHRSLPTTATRLCRRSPSKGRSGTAASPTGPMASRGAFLSKTSVPVRRSVGA